MEGSPFGRLPAELRNQIYELAQYSPQRIEVGASKDKDTNKRFTTAKALTATCARTRAECSQMFYHMNDFAIHCKDQRKVLITARNFLTEIGKKNASAIKKLTLVRDLGECDVGSVMTSRDIYGYRRIQYAVNQPGNFSKAFASTMSELRSSEPILSELPCDICIEISFMVRGGSKEYYTLCIDCADVQLSLERTVEGMREAVSGEGADSRDRAFLKQAIRVVKVWRDCPTRFA